MIQTYLCNVTAQPHQPNAVVAECNQIFIAMLQDLLLSLSKRVEAVLQLKGTDCPINYPGLQKKQWMSRWSDTGHRVHV